MLVAGLAKTLTLWTAVVVLAHHAYQSSSRAAAVDLRRPDGLPWIGGALLAGLALAAWLGRRRGTRWRPLGPDRTALALLMACAALEAWAHVEGHLSIRVIREEIPPQLAPLFPLWAALVPLWLGATAARLDPAGQGLRLLTLILAAGGALFLLPGTWVLTLAVPITLLQFVGLRESVRTGALARVALLAVVALVVATWFAHTPLLAAPALAWVLASACLGVAVAARPRTGDELRALVAAAVGAPLLVALADVVLVTELAQQVSWQAALTTRPTLFRQHPNFLAPLFAVGSLLAASLAWSARRARLAWLAAALLLAAATWHTDSNAGRGALLLGALLLPALPLGLPLLRRLPLRRLAVAVLLLGVLGAGAAWLLRDHPALALDQRVDRFEKSLDYRLDAWRNSLAVIRQYPLTGLGPGTFLSMERFEPDSRFFNEPTSPHPHNVFLYIAQAGGLPCLLLVVAWLLLLLRALLRAALHPEAHALGRPLALGLLATLLALLTANLLDLGLALETVVPGPVYLVTGLVLAGAARPTRASRAGPALLGCVALVLPWWCYGVQPVRADTLAERAQHRLFLAGHADDAETLHAAARADLRAAVELDRDHLLAHDLLARRLEALPGGHGEAHAVLTRLAERAPDYGPVHSLLAHFHLRLRDDVRAAQYLRRAIEDGHGSVHLRRDRARLIETLARLGQREAVFDELVENLRLEAAIIHSIHWDEHPETGELTLPVEGGRQRPVKLVDAVATLFDRLKRDELEGRPVGRRFWMDAPNAFRFANRPDLALKVYDWLEEHADRIPFVESNLPVFAKERGFIALEQGDLPAALAHFEHAASLSDNPYYVTQAEKVRALLEESGRPRAGGAVAGDGALPDGGAQPSPGAASNGGADAVSTGAAGAGPRAPGASDPSLGENEAARAFAETGEILDQPTALMENLESRAAARRAAGDPAGAARLVERSLLYEDELLPRAERWERAAWLYLEGGAAAAAEHAFLRALQHLDAKPLPLSTLLDGLAESAPARLARGVAAAWRAQGVDGARLLDAAWRRVPRYTSSRQAMGLFRMELAREAGRADQLLREAELALLDDPTSRPALWARLEACESLGRFTEMHAVMANLAQQFAAGGDPEARLGALVRSLTPRQHEPEAWREVGIARLMQGRYHEAAGLFASGGALVPAHDHRLAARLLGWEARARLLARDVASARRLLVRAVERDPERRLLAVRLAVLGPAGGAGPPAEPGSAETPP